MQNYKKITRYRGKLQKITKKITRVSSCRLGLGEKITKLQDFVKKGFGY